MGEKKVIPIIALDQKVEDRSSRLMNPSVLSEQELWDSFLKGNEHALACIYREYVGPLFNYGKQFTADEELIQDCIQDLFYTLVKSRKRIGKTNSIKFYLFSSLRRLISRKVKKENRYNKESLSWKNDSFQISLNSKLNPDQELFTQQQKKIIEAAFKDLSVRQREAILLLYYEGLRYKDIAKIMQIGEVKSARALVYRALKALWKALKNEKESLLH